MTLGDGLSALALALAISAIAGCEAYTKGGPRPPEPVLSIEQTCVKQWWPSKYCDALVKNRCAAEAKP